MHWAPTPTETKEGVVMSRDAAKVLYLLVGLTDKVAIFKGENRLLFQTGNWCMACRTPDTQFPPYNQVIPKHQTGKLRIESGLFVNAVKKLKLLASVRTEGIRLTYNQKLEIFVNNPELGDASVELNVSDWNQENPGHLDSPEIQIGFCATYLLEAVAKSKEFILKFDSELDPIIISDGERGAVVMPMRI